MAVTAAASGTEPALELEVSPASVRVGDPVKVVASARGGDGLLWGELTVALEPGGAWELIGGPTAVPEVRPPAWTLELAPMKMGEQTLPEITVSARSVDGEVTEVGSPSPPAVEVVSVLSGDEGDTAPAPVRDPIGARGLPWEWILPLCGGLLPFVVAAAWWWRGRGRTAASTVPALPPLAELEALAAELGAKIGREPAESVCDRLASGLRRYLERRTGEPAEEMTSFELRVLARRRGWPETTQRLVQQVMTVADGVRFGRRPAAEGELRQAVDMAVEAGRGVERFFAPAESSGDAAEAGG